jgi:hypothetical protein
MKKSYQVGEKVMHEYLGIGIVTEVMESRLSAKYNSYVVLFEQPPPIDYNLGKNPAIVCNDSLNEV